MNLKFKKLVLNYLEDYSDRLSNSGCNDWEWPQDFTNEDKKELMNCHPDINTLEQENINQPYHFMIIDALIGWLKNELD